jgi:hypothetical protein
MELFPNPLVIRSTPINSASWVCSEIGNIDSLPSGFCEIHFITVFLPSFAGSLLECLYNESLSQARWD